MPEIGYHASHEQFAASELLSLLQYAEQAGFRAGMCSDHLFPWSAQQGHSGFAWAWLGAALQATQLSLGVFNAPGYRYHPVIIAQACATLAEMFPGRFWIAVGSGEALNEHITGEAWPPKAERNARLRECVDVMRALWAGETVTHSGRICVHEARIYSRPAQAPLLLAGAITPETAAEVAEWADGLITVSLPREQLLPLLEAFRGGGGTSKPIFLQVKVSYARSDAEALQAAHEQWRTNIFPSSVLAELRLPEQFEAVAQYVTPEQLRSYVRISADPAQHLAWLQEDLGLGFDQILLHNVGRNQREFIDCYGEHVLPALT